MFDEINGEVEEIASSLGDSQDFFTQDDVLSNLRDIISTSNNGTTGATDASYSVSAPDKDESHDPEELLVNALNAYNEKYNLNLTPQTLTENLKIASFLGKKDRDINDLVKRGILGNAADHLYFKTLVSLYKLIDKSVQNLFNSDFANEFSMDTMMVIDRMFTWLSQLEALKQKYQIYDFDKTMTKLIDTEVEQDTTTVSPVPALMKKLMNMKKE